MTALQSIIKEAKALKVKYPKRYSKWTDYVKQASAIYATKNKLKIPVAKKKIGAKKPISKHKDTKSHNVNIRVVSGVKKKSIAKKKAKKVLPHKTTIDKLKKSLNKENLRLQHGYNLTSGKVRIGALNIQTLKDYQDVLRKINIYEKELFHHKLFLKNKAQSLENKYYIRKQIISIKKYLSELKKQKIELKKLL